MISRRYTVMTDSHGRRFLKEEGYGIIGMLTEGDFIRPLNKGLDWTQRQLREALSLAEAP